MKLEDCKIGTKYRLTKDTGLHKNGSVVECVGLIQHKAAIGWDIDSIIVYNKERQTYTFIPCDSIIQDLSSVLDKITESDWETITANRGLEVYKNPQPLSPYTKKLTDTVKKIFYTTQECKISVSEPHKYGIVDRLQVGEFNEVEKKCTCPMDMLMNVGCRCGGK